MLDKAIVFATNILFRATGRQFPGTALREHIRPCFPAGTLILTERGLIPIEDVAEGDRVLTHENRWRSVLRSWQTGESETVKVHGQGAVLECTPDHPIWSREKLPRSDMKDRKRKLGAPEWEDASRMVGRLWAMPTQVEPLPWSVPESLAADAEKESFWWTIGRWVGDGWTEAEKKNPNHRANRVILCCGKHELSEIIDGIDDLGWDWNFNEESTTVRFAVVNSPLRDWLREEFGTRAYNKRIPAWLFGMPVHLREAFLEGYVSADGYTTTRSKTNDAKLIKSSTVSRELSCGLKLLVAGLGYAPMWGAYKTPKAGTIEGRIVNMRQLYSLAWGEQTNPKFDGRPSVMSWAEFDHLWMSVRKVVSVDDIVPVYDLEVEEDHSFVAEGIVVHNCKGYGGSGCGCGCGGGAADGWGAGSGLAAFGGWNSYWWESALGGWQSQYPFSGLLCACSGGCNGCVLPGVILPSPVVSVEEVVINGFVVDPAEYAVQDYRSLVRYTLDSNGCLLGWPCVNVRSSPSSAYPDPSNPDGTRENTWELSFTYGRGPGPDGVTACAQYACQLALLWCNAANPACRLPYRIQNLQREGINIQFVDPSLFLTNGMTGLPEVDTWIRSVNSNGNIRRPSLQRLGRPSRNIESITG